MPTIPAKPHLSSEDLARRGDEIYEQSVHPRLGAGSEGRFVVIDIATGDYEVDADELAAADRLRARHPEAQIWLRQIGSHYARRFGARHRTAAA